MNRESGRGGFTPEQKKPSFDVREKDNGLKEVAKTVSIELPTKPVFREGEYGLGPKSSRNFRIMWEGKNPDAQNGLPLNVEAAVREWIFEQSKVTGSEGFAPQGEITVRVADLREKPIRKELEKMAKKLSSDLKKNNELPHWYESGWHFQGFPDSPGKTAIPGTQVTEVNAFLRLQALKESGDREMRKFGDNYLLVQMDGHQLRYGDWGDGKKPPQYSKYGPARRFGILGYDGNRSNRFEKIDSDCVWMPKPWTKRLTRHSGDVSGHVLAKAVEKIDEKLRRE